MRGPTTTRISSRLEAEELRLRALAGYDDDAQKDHEDAMVRQHDESLNLSDSVGGREGVSMVQGGHAWCTDVSA